MRLIVIEQANINGGKIALVQHLGDFLALERGCTYDRGAVEFTASGGVRSGYGFDGIVHAELLILNFL